MIDRSRPSVIGVVASWLVVVLSGSLKDVAIRLFGTNDKTALVAGIVIVAMVVGGVLGMLGSRRTSVMVLALAGFGVLGVAAAHRDPLASSLDAAVASLLGVLAGSAGWVILTRSPGPGDPTPGGRPADGGTNRRRFLLLGGALAAVTVGATMMSHWWRARLTAVPASLRGALPPAKRVTPISPGESFAVDGLTPYVTPSATFYRIDTATFVPVFDMEVWRLRITGMVDHPVSYTYDDLATMDLIEEPVTIACVSNDVGGHLIGNGRWRGVPLAALLQRAGIHREATQIIGRSIDDFTVGIPTATATDGRVAMVAIGLNGEVLPAEHGFPARLIVAGLYGYASATKWLTEIELTRREDVESFWVERGWAKDGPIKTETRIDVPASGATIAAGTVVVAGVAWAPTVGIAAVEVQIDRGDWRRARLGTVASANTWVQWMYEWTDAMAGAHVLAARAIDRTGRVQTDQTRPPEPQGATGYPYRGFTVA